MTSSDNIKQYSVDNYDALTIEDISKIKNAFEEGRIKILRYLALGAKEKEDAKTYENITEFMQGESPDNMYSLQATVKQCKKLIEIGVIYVTRSKSHDSKWAGEYIKLYFVAENVIEIIAILAAYTLGLDRDAAKKIKEAIHQIFEQSSNVSISGSRVIDIQKQSFDVVRNITHNYIKAQKDIINWWSKLGEQYCYYYLWFYPPNFANTVSQAYRSFADYLTSGLTIAQNNIDGYIDMSKIYFTLVEDNANELLSHIILPRAPKMPAPIPPLPPIEERDLDALIKLRDELTEIVQITLIGA
ncbi:MAG: hypothetical protein M3275_01965 [Thermoproteota archaeon]|nr:hypothetical protein [Thermoproteota archaeon]